MGGGAGRLASRRSGVSTILRRQRHPAEEDDIPSRWNPAAVAAIERTAANTTPIIDPGSLSRVLPGLYVWDFWPVRTADGEIADLGGRTGWVALAVPADIEPEDRHFVALLRFASSASVDTAWTDHGPLFPGGRCVGARQWAGSTVFDTETGRVDTYYTACGRLGEAEVTFEQRIVHACGHLKIVDGVPEVGNWGPHTVVLAGDGVGYASTVGEKAFPGRINAFRDPAFFRDPVDGAQYLVFTATMVGGTTDFDGAVGIARRVGATWELEAPLLTADGVNKELERPHLVVSSGRYYLFFTTHHWTFAPGVIGPEGLYGFVAEELHGRFVPLNGTGLVFGNPPTEPHQAYSWLVLNDGTVLSFADYPGLAGRSLEAEAAKDPTFKKRLFGGTAAPPLRLHLDAVRAVLE